MRRDLLPYFGLPFYRAMLERSGFGDAIAAFDEAAGARDAGRMQAAIPERFLDVLSRSAPPRTSAPASPAT